MREAYTLLRQSIIHVEQDDIDFDEEEREGEREGDRRPRANTADAEESQDVGMSAADKSFFVPRKALKTSVARAYKGSATVRLKS